MPPRKSARKVATAKAQDEASGSLEKTGTSAKSHTRRKPKLSSAIENDVEPVAPSGKRRPSRRKGTKSDGNLKIITEMPLDILLEIFSNVNPGDLLNLSLTTKFLWTLLTSTNTAYLWNLVYERLPLHIKPPKIPDGLSIFQYTNFLYGKHCQICTSPNGRITHDAALLRFCVPCARKNLLAEDSLTYPNGDATVAKLCSWAHIYEPQILANKNYVAKAEYDVRLGELNLIRKTNTNGIADYRAKWGTRKMERESLRSLIIDWRRNVKSYEDDQLRQLQRERDAAITKRLNDEGYGLLIGGILISHLPGARAPHALSDEEWTLIRADLIDAIHQQHDRVLESHLTSAFLSRLNQLEGFINSVDDIANPHIIPPTIYIAQFEPFHSVIKGNDWVKRVTKEDFKGFDEMLKEVVKAWRDDADEYALSLIPNPKGGKGAKGKEKDRRRPLEYATTFFKCQWCDDPLTYPRILLHSCLLQHPMTSVDGSVAVEDTGKAKGAAAKASSKKKMANQTTVRTPQPRKEITFETTWAKILRDLAPGFCKANPFVTFDKDTSARAAGIIKLCGEDVGSVSFSEMAEKGHRVECVRCEDKKRGKRLVMDWKTAVLHDINDHQGAFSTKGWKLLSKEDTDKAKKAERRLNLQWEGPPHVCNRCHLRIKDSDDLATHLRQFHQIIVPKDELSQIWTEFLDTPLNTPPYAVKI